MKPKTQIRIGLWGITALFIKAGFTLLFPPKNVYISERGSYILLILFFCYIMGMLYNKLILAKTSYRIFLVLYVFAVICLIIGVISPTISTTRFAELSIAGRLKVLAWVVAVLLIPTILMWTGIRGLSRMIEDESLSNNTHLKQKRQVTKFGPETKIKIGLWGTTTLFFMFVYNLLTKSTMSDILFGCIFLIIFSCYIMSIIFRKLDLAIISYRIYFALFAIFFVCMILAVFAKTRSTVSGFLGLMAIFLAFNAISITIMLIGIKGLRQIIKMETECKLNEEQTSTVENAGGEVSGS